MKNVNLLQPIYIKKYIDIHRYTVHLYIDISIYRTCIYRYIEHNISIFPIYQYIVAIPNHQNLFFNFSAYLTNICDEHRHF